MKYKQDINKDIMKKGILSELLCFALCGTLAVVPSEAMNQRQSKKADAMKIRVTPLEENRARIELPAFEGTVLTHDNLEQVYLYLKKYLKKEPDKTNVRVTFVLPQSVTKIGERAFLPIFEVLEKLDVPDQHPLETIEAWAFEHCENLSSIGGNRLNPFPKLKSIEEKAFAYCFKLQTPPFNENTPLTHIGRCAFSGVGLPQVRIPKTLRYLDFCEGSFKKIFVPKDAVIESCYLSSLNIHPTKKEDPVSVTIEPDGHPLVFLFSLKKLMHQRNVRCEIALNKNKNGQLEDSAVLIANDPPFWRIPPLIYRIHFSPLEDITHFAKTAYETYTQKKRTIANKKESCEELFNCLSHELILYAFSRNIEELLRNLDDENVRRFVYDCFVLIRYLTGFGCDDVFTAMEKCESDASVNFELIQSAFLLENQGVPDEERTSMNFINFIRNDDVEKLQHFISQTNHPIDRPIGDVLGKSGYRLSVSSYEENPEELSPIELAALLGSLNVFKFLLLQYVSGDDLPFGLFRHACYGGNYDIIHALERIAPSRDWGAVFAEECMLDDSSFYIINEIIEILSVYRIHPDIVQYLQDNYLPKTPLPEEHSVKE